MARKRRTCGVNRGSFRTGSTCRAGQRAPRSVWVYGPAGFGSDPRGCAVHLAAGVGHHCGRSALLKSFETGPAEYAGGQLNPAYQAEIKTRSPTLAVKIVRQPKKIA